MPNTPNLTLPYPQLSDAPNVPQHIQALASAIDGRSAVTGTVTAQTGWSLVTGDSFARKVLLGSAGLALVTVQISATRTGATIGPASTAGNITDVVFGTVPAGFRPDSISPVSFQVIAGAPASGKLEAGGGVEIQELAPSTSITATTVVRFTLTYLTTSGN